MARLASLGRLVLALAAAVACAAPSSARSSATPKATSGDASISAYDLIELQIAFTTLLAVYYKPVAPSTLAGGARTGVAAELTARGLGDIALPFVPANVDRGRGAEYVDGLVLHSLARARGRIDGHRLVAAAVAGELASLHDPYTLAFRPQQFKTFNAFLGNASFGGIGAIVASGSTQTPPHVERVLADGPAAAAGLQAGDVLVAIDGRRIAAIARTGLRDALRGRTGTTVRLEVARGDERLTLAIVRAKLRDPEVTPSRVGDVGVLALSRFGDRAGAELAASVADLRARGATSFVLDLRGNGGGYGDEATAVAGVFMAGPIFITRDRSGVAKIARATAAAPVAERLAVLVDGDTASAAEIVAGALQDAGRAAIVGTRTFGKGLVQSVYPLPDGSALKITTARYTTPSGRDIDRVGIRPDVEVATAADGRRGDPAGDAPLARAIALLTAPSPDRATPAI
ncbi:MAG: hypothetical protein NVSMB59_10280 [Vulcanimicrobiaceae bacterium]